jgi:hypothetical protein
MDLIVALVKSRNTLSIGFPSYTCLEPNQKKKKENEIVLVLFTFTKTIRVTNSYDFPFYAWKECFKNSSFNFYNISIEKNLESSLGCSKGEQASD